MENKMEEKISREAILERYEFDKILLTDPLERFTQKPLENFSINKSGLFDSLNIRIEEGTVLNDLQDKPDIRGEKKEQGTGESKANNTKQDRYELTMKVLVAEFGFDPAEKITHDTKKIGTETADRYLIKFKYKGEPLCMIVTDWYGYAVYIMKRSQYSQNFKPTNRTQNGVSRFYWIFEGSDKNSPKEPYDALSARIREKLDKLVP